MEKLLSRSADNAEQPLVNYLLAAEAAQQRSDNLRANQYLERASELAGVISYRWISPVPVFC